MNGTIKERVHLKTSNILIENNTGILVTDEEEKFYTIYYIIETITKITTKQIEVEVCISKCPKKGSVSLKRIIC